MVIGDSFGEWLAYGLEQVFAETPQIGIVRKIKTDFGLVRDDARLDAPEWMQAIKDLLPATEKANAIVVMLGVNDRSSLRERAPPAKEATSPSDAHPGPAAATAAPRQPPSASFEFHTDKWAELYSKRIDDMIAALKARGVPIIWVGLPAIRGAKSTTDMSYLDELYRARADKAGIAYVDIWDGFVDDQGRYVQDGPDFEGQTRRLRTYDGVYFTKAGAEKLGHYVEHDLRRVLSSHVLPVALPGPEEQSPAKDAVGPVLPLNATGTEKSGELVGAAKQPAEREAAPLAARVLNRGEAVVAPRGRAQVGKRSRVLTNNELRAIWPHLGGAHGQVIKWLLWTGCRLSEATGMAWGEVENDFWTIPSTRRKNGQSHTVPLPRQAGDMLRTAATHREESQSGSFVFPSTRGRQLSNWGWQTKRLHRLSRTSGWHRHDLRRTVATLLGDLGFAPHVVSVVLGHAHIAQGATAVYARSRYQREHREALQALADEIDRIVSDVDNVVRLSAIQK